MKSLDHSTVKNNRGFSLVEVLIAVSILTVVVTPIISTFISSSKLNFKAKRELAATEIAQNMFETITSMGDPEDAILELSALTMPKVGPDPDPLNEEKTTIDRSLLDLTNVRTVLPKLDQNPTTGASVSIYDQIVEACVVKHVSPIDPTDIVYTTEFDMPSMTHPYFAKSVEAETDPAGGITKYRIRGYNATSDVVPSRICEFYIQGLKQKNTYYDVKVRFDASNYTDYADSATDPIIKKAYSSLPVISSIKSYDSVYKEDPNAMSDVVSLQYQSTKLRIPKEDYEVLENLKRTIRLDVKKVSDSPARYSADVAVTYDYKKTADLFTGTDPQYTVNRNIYDSDVSPRNIFIYYVPNYNSKDGNVLDNFEVYNENDLDVNVYLIRTVQNDTYFDGHNVTDVNNETYYYSNLYVKETDDATLDTHIRSNLQENIAQAEYADRTNATSIPHLIWSKDYTNDTLAPSVVQARDVADMKNLESLNDEGQERKYDITIEVYVGKSGTVKGDHNHYVNYEGAFDNNQCTDRADLLASFSGSIIK